MKQVTGVVPFFILTILMVGYQNCSRTQFSQSSVDSPSLKLASDVGLNASAVSSNEVTGTDPSVTSTNSENDDSKNCANGGSNSADNSSLIECEIMSANSKVILSLGNILDSGSNSAISRICMSENACLKIINNYAAARSCKLATGKAASNSQTQCAKIFPGSKGTCKNAQLLSDAEVEKILAKMAAQ